MRSLRVSFGAAFRISFGIIWEKADGLIVHSRAVDTLNTMHIASPSSTILAQFISPDFFPERKRLFKSVHVALPALFRVFPLYPEHDSGPGLHRNKHMTGVFVF